MTLSSSSSWSVVAVIVATVATAVEVVVARGVVVVRPQQRRTAAEMRKLINNYQNEVETAIGEVEAPTRGEVEQQKVGRGGV